MILIHPQFCGFASLPGWFVDRSHSYYNGVLMGVNEAGYTVEESTFKCLISHGEMLQKLGIRMSPLHGQAVQVLTGDWHRRRIIGDRLCPKGDGRYWRIALGRYRAQDDSIETDAEVVVRARWKLVIA